MCNVLYILLTLEYIHSVQTKHKKRSETSYIYANLLYSVAFISLISILFFISLSICRLSTWNIFLIFFLLCVEANNITIGLWQNRQREIEKVNRKNKFKINKHSAYYCSNSMNIDYLLAENVTSDQKTTYNFDNVNYHWKRAKYKTCVSSITSNYKF